MKRELKAIERKAGALLAETERARKNAETNLRLAHEGLRKSAAAGDSARVADKEKRIVYYEKVLEHIKNTPRMERTEYQAAIDTCEQIMEDAAAKYQRRAADAMLLLLHARQEFEENCREVNEVLQVLDDGANILQSEYGKTWFTHAARFDCREVLEAETTAATLQEMSETPGNNPRAMIRAAWDAAEWADSE